MITDPGAIAFSNEQIRPCADKMAKSYRYLKTLNQAWTASAGTAAQNLVIFAAELTRVATFVGDSYFFVNRANHLWSALSMNPLFPNDPAQLVFDNGSFTAQDPGRPPITGQDVQRVQARMTEFLAWMEKAAFDPASVNVVDWANLRTVLRMAGDGSKTPTAAWGTALAVTRAGEIVTQYDVTVPANLSQILRVAVNP